MHLKQLTLSTIRNLQPVTLDFSKQFNWIFGKNGSGKTSLLETLSLLCTGRSFRTRYAEEFIQEGQVSCIASGILGNTESAQMIRLGFERHRVDGLRLRHNEQPCETLSEWVKILPLQVLNLDSFQLLSAGPSMRRQFLDWAMFHVEPSYFPHLQRYRRVLKQRNAVLKSPTRSPDQVKIWDPELIEAGEAVTALREAFMAALFPILRQYLAHFLPTLAGKQGAGGAGDVWAGLTLKFHRGFEAEHSLAMAMDRNFRRDNALGYTTVGAHRADFGFFLNHVPIETRLSRGQLKLFISALYLARSEFLTRHAGSAPVSLVDDLGSELDNEAAYRLLQGLLSLQAQVFATSIEGLMGAEALEMSESRMFHVEQGVIVPIQG